MAHANWVLTSTDLIFEFKNEIHFAEVHCYYSSFPVVRLPAGVSQYRLQYFLHCEILYAAQPQWLHRLPPLHTALRAAG